jgi:hypothetical protein
MSRGKNIPSNLALRVKGWRAACRSPKIPEWLKSGLRRAIRRAEQRMRKQAAGGSLKDAQAQLGHTKLSTTLELYTLPVPDHQRAAVKNLARMVTNGDEREPSAEELPPATQQIQ